MPHESRFLFFLAVCLIGAPLAAQNPPAEAPGSAGPPLPVEEELLAPEERLEADPERPSPGTDPESPVPEELRPVPAPGTETDPRSGAPRDSYWSSAAPRPDGPLVPLTRSKELLPPPRKYRSLMQLDLQPRGQAGFHGLYTERRNRNRYNTTGTGTFFGEVPILDYASLFAEAPYTRKDEPESAAREHTDNVSAGMKFAPGDGALRPAMGFEVFFTTGNEDLGIGSQNKGNLETYFGFVFAARALSLQGNLRYNTQSNLELNPPPGVKFQRTWFVDLGIGFRLDAFEFVLELTRMGRVAPDEDSLWSTVITPGINIGAKEGRGFVFSVGVPWTLSRGRQYDYGLFMRGMWAY